MKNLTSFLLVLTLGAAFSSLGALAAPEPAHPADDFVDRIGVVTHWGYGDTPYGYAYDKIKTLLGTSGIRHVRDGAHPHLLDLYKTYGIKDTMIFGPKTAPSAAVGILKENLPLVDMVEGPNEVDVFASSASYEGKTFPAGPIAYQNALYAAVKADLLTRSLGVIAPSTAQNGSNIQLAPLASLDYLVMHSYAGGAPPETSLEGGYVPNTLNAARILGPGAVLKPIVVTESGYHTSLGGSGVIAGVQPGVSEAAQAKYLPRHFAAYFNAGIARTLTYEFADEFDNEATNAEASFGIIRHDLTPKPAYTTVKNLISMLSEAHWDSAAQKWSKVSFAPRALDFDLVCDAAVRPALRHTLLQKSNGDFYLLVWREISSFDTEHKKDIANPAVPVTLTLKTPIKAASVYSLRNVLSPILITHGFQSLTLPVSDKILVVKLTPKPIADAPAPPRPSPVAGTATGDTVTLSWPLAPAKSHVAGYFVSRLGRELGRATGTAFIDTKRQPATGYLYEVRSYDAAGRLSAPASVVVMTRSELPNLVATDLTLTPAAIKPGDAVQFGVTIKNSGTGPTPLGITHGIAFFVDGAIVNWSDTFTGPLLPGESKTLTANNGPRSMATWMATPGVHTLEAQVDDLHRITQSGDGAHSLKKSFTVSAPNP